VSSLHLLKAVGITGADLRAAIWTAAHGKMAAGMPARAAIAGQNYVLPDDNRSRIGFE